MSTRKKLIKVIPNIFRQIQRVSIGVMKQLMTWLLRILHGNRRGRRASQAGFVLPTVTMVILVVILLTTAILLRSFDRSKNVSNYRVNEAVLNAATPALDRARAKLDALLVDPVLPRATPSDQALYNAFLSSKYDFGDETRVKLGKDINNSGALTADEAIKTGWKFPVDTDNNGKFDSFTLYGIYFINPPRSTSDPTKFARARSPIESRGFPMNDGSVSGICTGAGGTSASLVSGADWFQTNGKLKKAFFVYTATVPITNIGSLGTTKYEVYKGNKGFSSLEMQQDRVRIPLNNNAVWFEDDIEVAYSTDFRLNGRLHTNSNLLVAGSNTDNRVRFYQVSSPASCFYQVENSKMVVAGNVGNGDIGDTADKGATDGFVDVHLFRGSGTNADTSPRISTANKTTTATGGASVGFYTAAYAQRIGVMVDGALRLHDKNNPSQAVQPTVASVSNAANRYPKEVIQKFADNYQATTAKDDLTKVLDTYFRERTRKVPYAEIAYPNAVNAVIVGTTTLTSNPDETGANKAFVFSNSYVSGELRPLEQWMRIEDPTTGAVTAYTNLPLQFNSNNTQDIEATDPALVRNDLDKKENYIGDRLLFGNNLPTRWYKGVDASGSPLFANKGEPQLVTKNGTTVIYWNNASNGATTNQRQRFGRLETLDDLGDTTRGGYWEQASAKAGKLVNEKAAGGLRIVTGAGIYIDGTDKASGGTGVRGTDSFLPTPPTADKVKADFTDVATYTDVNTVVWPDTMPMWDGTKKGDLQMRATAVYHYTNSANTNQAPLACVSSYYDPSSKSATGANAEFEPNTQSNNGRVFAPPYTSDTDRLSQAGSAGTYGAKLRRQAKMVFPNGRLVNPQLRQALAKLDASPAVTLDLADNAAIDAEICALKILDGATVSTSPPIPTNAIREKAFLDGRQVQALHKLNDAGSNGTVLSEAGTVSELQVALANTALKTAYDLPLEERQPLEIRVTEIDLGALRTQTIGSPTDTTYPNNDQEYLIPNSGIIYASRNDAVPDTSSAANRNSPSPGELLISATDSKLDPTRRPNGIRLVNGSNLARDNKYRLAEKGLIMVSDLPLYIKGDFNLHQKPADTVVREEFNETLTLSPDNFYSRGRTSGGALKSDRDLNLNFACRQGQTSNCTEGDQWRSAVILSDAITLLSNSFQDGYRNQGDYDLRNNAGNTVIDKRLKNGFWSNNYVTSALWWNTANTLDTPYPSGKTTDSYVGSYLMNGVTPIQRRTTYPEYIMEICRKLPVSSCSPGDWYVGYDSNGDGALTSAEQNVRANKLGLALGGTTLDTAKLAAGTTAKPALLAADRIYPRRVAFARNDYKALIFTQITTGSGSSAVNKAAAKPMGVGCPLDTTGTNPDGNGCQYPNSTTRTAGTHLGTAAKNALWFWSTADVTGDPGSSISYDADKPLYYVPPSAGGTKLILPDTACFNKDDVTDCSTTVATVASGYVNLNLPTTDRATDYLYCLSGNSGNNSGQSKNYSVTGVGGVDCSNSTINAIDLARNTLLSTTNFPVTQTLPASPLSGTPTITATQKVNVIDFTAYTVNAGTVITLDAGAQTDPIFVFRAIKTGGNADWTFNANSTSGGVQFKLNNVNQNDVYWVFSDGANPVFQDAPSTKPHIVPGNFIGKSSTNNNSFGNNVKLTGRILGFTTVPGMGTGTTFTAVTSDGQPLLVPMLQIHTAKGTPGASTAFDGWHNDQWVQHVPSTAATTTFNAVLVMGDTPSRPAGGGTLFETGGGLTNFPRFLEAWEAADTGTPERTAKISGGFIQFKKSYFATAPFEAINPNTTDTSLFYDGATPTYAAFGLKYQYRGGASARNAPYYRAPNRVWGYDVGLLSQSPDLFSQRFTSPPTGRPNEFFKEVGRDDVWVQTLLCAAQKTASGYEYAVEPGVTSPTQRPTDCPAISNYTVGD